MAGQDGSDTSAQLRHAIPVRPRPLAGAEHGAAIAEYPPAVVKKTIVNRGAATKGQVGYMVAKLLGLKSAPTPADAADGVAIALTHLLRRPHAARRAVS